MSWYTKILFTLLKFSLSRLLPGNNFVIWVFDTNTRQVKSSMFLDQQKDGSFNHKVIAMPASRPERTRKR